MARHRRRLRFSLGTLWLFPFLAGFALPVMLANAAFEAQLFEGVRRPPIIAACLVGYATLVAFPAMTLSTKAKVGQVDVAHGMKDFFVRWAVSVIAITAVMAATGFGLAVGSMTGTSDARLVGCVVGFVVGVMVAAAGASRVVAALPWRR